MPETLSLNVNRGVVADHQGFGEHRTRSGCKVRRGEIETLEGFRMASILGIMRQCLEGSDAEKRLAELESLSSKPNVVPFKQRHG
jgi:hypothetical protein